MERHIDIPTWVFFFFSILTHSIMKLSSASADDGGSICAEELLGSEEFVHQQRRQFLHRVYRYMHISVYQLIDILEQYIIIEHIYRAFQMAQSVKRLPAMQETWV